MTIAWLLSSLEKRVATYQKAFASLDTVTFREETV